jgi:hypothetical protein
MGLWGSSGVIGTICSVGGASTVPSASSSSREGLVSTIGQAIDLNIGIDTSFQEAFPMGGCEMGP